MLQTHQFNKNLSLACKNMSELLVSIYYNFFFILTNYKYVYEKD